MTTDTQKITKRVQFLATEDQVEKLRLLKFYSGKTIGEILRIAVDTFDPKDFKEGNHE